VVVHPPLPTFDWTNNELEKRIAEVRDLYVDTLDDWPVHNADGDKVR
jgi:putative phosphoserine phosphatase/1-acylglycerol-3-phosphate O-acyltransferase